MKMTFDSPKIVTISGTSSNSGKTTLLCELMRRFSVTERWEAIKLTKGHYRSCGKDPEACCVSDLLGEQATLRSGRDATYTAGKDTARYWDAGAANVHWVIATDAQVEAGIREALARVQTPNVLIEGTSVLNFLKSDFAILAVGSDLSKPKASARRALIERKFNALFLSAESANLATSETLVSQLANLSPAVDRQWLEGLPVFRPENLDDLARNVFALAGQKSCQSKNN
jgi:molybdopterin-guanine dinucleotide biosynthesis protein